MDHQILSNLLEFSTAVNQSGVSCRYHSTNRKGASWYHVVVPPRNASEFFPTVRLPCAQILHKTQQPGTYPSRSLHFCEPRQHINERCGAWDVFNPDVSPGRGSLTAIGAGSGDKGPIRLDMRRVGIETSGSPRQRALESKIRGRGSLLAGV
jgi:hypothetical protein